MKPFCPTALSLEEAILAALTYSDLFSYPLTAEEIWFWLPKKAALEEVTQLLGQLVKRKKISYQFPFYFLNDSAVISLRQEKEKFSQKKLPQAESFGRKLARLPWLGLVALSGNLAIGSARENDDIDFFIIALSGCLYRARLASVLLAEVLGQRRRPEEKEAADKVCLNLFLEEDNLILPRSRQDFYTAHEALQLLPIAGDNSFYQRFLLANNWLVDFLPQAYQERLKKTPLTKISVTKKGKKPKINFLEKMAMFGQLAYARCHRRQLVKGDSRQLFFHPQDQRQLILARFQKNWQKLTTS